MSSVYSVSREQFEQRMRARRAATCLAVARSAIASGRMVEAIDRLEEASALDPNLAEARLLLEELRSQEPAESATTDVRVPRSEMSGWSHWVAAAIAICALAALAFLWPAGPSRQDGAVAPMREAPSAAPPHEPLPAATGTEPPGGLTAEYQQQLPEGLPSAVGTAGDADGRSARAPDERGVAIRVTEQPVVQRAPAAATPSESSPGEAASQAARADSRDIRGAAPASPAPAAPAPQNPPQNAPQNPPQNAPQNPPQNAPQNPPQNASLNASQNAPQNPAQTAAAATVAENVSPVPAAVTPRPSPPQLPPLQRVPVVDETPVKPVATPDLETASAPVSRANDVATEASLRPPHTDTGAIEGTLRRYADAYARLDAAAARAVWPTVDQRALARAFEGLQSQGIVFEHCDVAVAGDDATAACNGRAHFVPKVGSREPLVERRQWTFRLRKADAGWQITQAEAR